MKRGEDGLLRNDKGDEYRDVNRGVFRGVAVAFGNDKGDEDGLLRNDKKTTRTEARTGCLRQ